MAKIENKDIFGQGVISKTTEDAKILLKTLDQLEKSFVDIAKSQQKIINKEDNKTIQSVQKTTAAINELNNVEKDSEKIQKEKLKLQKAVQRERLSELKLQKDRENAFDRFEKQEQRAIKTSIKNRKAILDQNNAFKVLTKQVNSAQARFKRLAAQHGVNSKQAQKANIAFSQLDDRLRRINKTARDGRRDVGRYGLAFREVGISMKSLFLAGGVVGVIRGIGAAFGDAFTRVREFDKEIQNISGLTGIARKDLGGLERDIISIAGSSIRTANEVAKLASTLFTLGNSQKDVRLLLKPVNDLSIALGATSEEAADFLGQTLNAFGKGADSGQRFADIIANVRSSTALDFQRIKDALGFVAPTANALGLTLGQVSAQLGVLQDNGIKASRAGRLLSSSFARLVKKGKSLDQALKEINQSQNKINTATALFGVESFTLGLILADNVEKTADLANEFDNLSEGSLKTLTESQLDALDAKLKIADSAWESLILTIDKGNGPISNFFKSATDGLTKFLVQLKRINQSFTENLTEDLRDRNKDFISNLNNQISDNIDLKKSEVDQEIAILESRKNRNIISEKSFNNQREKLIEDFDSFKDGARNEQLQKEKDFLQNTVNEQVKSADITVENAEKELERLDEISKNKISRISSRDVNFALVERAREEQKQALEKKGLVQSIVINKDRIRLINLLLEEGRKAIDLEEESLGNGAAKINQIKELTGLIEKQAKVVSDLNAQIQRARTEEDILGFSKQADIAKEELDRLKRIVSSSLEEIDKIERNLIEDSTERRIAQEKEKSDKLIKQIETNSRVEADRKNDLIVQETERFQDFELNEAIKANKKRIKQEADFARAEVEQRRTGFKTQEEFEEFKSEQFLAIQRNQLQAELDLLEFSNREQDELRREQLKAQIEGLHDLGKGFEDLRDLIGDIVQVIGDMIDEAFDKRIEAIGDKLEKTGENIDRLREKATEGRLESEESLAFEQKQEIELARQKEREQKRQERTQAFFAVLSSFNSNDGNLPKTIADISVLKALAGGFTAFDGVDDTGSRGKIDSKGGKLWTLHPNEQVHSLKDRKDMKDPLTGKLRSRNEIKDIIGMHDSGFMMNVLNSGSNELMNNSAFVLNGMNTGAIESKLDAINKGINGIVIPENHFDYDLFRNIFEHKQKLGNKTKITHTKLF